MSFNRKECWDIKTFDSWEEETEDASSLRPSTKFPKSVPHADGSRAVFGKNQKKNPSQTRGKKNGLKTSTTPTVEGNKQINSEPNTSNNQKARKPDAGWSNDPLSKTGGSSDGESPSKAKKDKGPAAINSIPKARQRRIRIDRSKK